MSCDAQTLLNAAYAAGWGKLSVRLLKESIAVSSSASNITTVMNGIYSAGYPKMSIRDVMEGQVSQSCASGTGCTSASVESTNATNGYSKLSTGDLVRATLAEACANASPTPPPSPVLASSIARYIGINYVASGTRTLPDSIGGFNMVQANAAAPTKVALGDGNSYVHFTDNDFQHLDCPSFTAIPQPVTISMLWRLNVSNNGIIILGSGSAPYIRDSGDALQVVSSGPTFLDGSNAWTLATWFATTIRLNGGSSSIVNNDNVSYPTTGSVASDAFGGTNVYMCGFSDIGTKIPMDLLEMNIYNAALSSANITTIYNYYKATYPGASLP